MDEYISRYIEFEVEYEYSIKKDDFGLFRKEYIQKLNEICKKDNIDIVSVYFRDFIYYDSSDIRKYHTSHKVPFTKIGCYIVYKQKQKEWK